MPQDGLQGIPAHLLRSELARRQQQPDNASSRPACGSTGPIHPYNTPLHIFALFLILLLSTFACSFPLIVRRYPTLPVPNRSLFLSRHFGTGVLIATAFVHLLPTAYVSLTDPCLPRFWNEVYPPMAGFIAMCSVLVVVGIEMFFGSQGAGHSHGGMDYENLREGMGSGREGRDGGTQRSSSNFKRFRQGPIGGSMDLGEDDVPLSPTQRSPYSDTPGALDKPLPPPPPEVPDKHLEEDDSDLDLDELDPETSDTQPLTGSSDLPNGHHRPKPVRHVSFASPPRTPSPQPTSPSDHHQEQRLILQVLLLEAGILFHSIFIGLALSVSTGPAFIVLLIAISFHQTFEGLALGSRIAAIPSFSTTSLKPWIMSLMYGITTPVGQAIGLGVHSLYDPESEVGLLMVGVVNGVSCGLLVYAGLVQLLAEDFLSDHSYIELQGRRRLEAAGAVVCGAMLMAFVGAFA